MRKKSPSVSPKGIGRALTSTNEMPQISLCWTPPGRKDERIHCIVSNVTLQVMELEQTNDCPATLTTTSPKEKAFCPFIENKIIALLPVVHGDKMDATPWATSSPSLMGQPAFFIDRADDVCSNERHKFIRAMGNSPQPDLY